MNSMNIVTSLFNGIYQNKRVLITGHTGFKGSWLALWLHKLGAKITGLALSPNTVPSHFNLIRLQDLIAHVEGDIRDGETVRKTFEQANPEIVFHLAAQAIVRDSYDDPKTTFDINLGGTVNIMEAVRSCPSVKAVVVVTSDKCYENKEWVWGYRENDPIGGHDPYSASKGATEIICAAYLRSYFDKNGRGPHIGFATARAGNVIGGGDWAKDRIIPDCVRSLSKGEPIIVRNPNATRPWQHVLDPLSGYLLLAKQLLEDPEHFSGPWNFGPVENGQIKVIELVEKFIKEWGSGQIETPPLKVNTPHEAHILRLCIDRAVHELSWKPRLDNGDAIDFTVDWYKSWHKGENDLQQLSFKQIHDYMNCSVE
jgi:CDP-glucose 4,6-dehydratase